MRVISFTYGPQCTQNNTQLFSFSDIFWVTWVVAFEIYILQFFKGTTVQVICHFGFTEYNMGVFIVSMVMMLRYVKNKWSNPGKRMAENDLFPVKTFYNHGGKFQLWNGKKKLKTISKVIHISYFRIALIIRI